MPRLFDLVRFKDDKFRTAFFYGLRNTLVAKDLEQATKIAYQVKSAITGNLLCSVLQN